MKSGHYLSISLCLNLALFGALAILTTRRAQEAARESVSAEPPITEPVAEAPFLSSTPDAVVELARSAWTFQWAQVASENYPQYIDNLRAIGCPETTIRDIIRAEVDDLFSRRVKDLVDTVQNRFWDLLVSRQEFEDMVEEKHKQLNDLDDEREILLKELLGRAGTREGYRREDAGFEREVDQRRLLDYLPPDKVAALLGVDARFEHARLELSDLDPPLEQKELQARIQELREHQSQDREARLSPEELAEYRLRTSKASELRFHLDAFEITEAEMREVVAIEQKRSQNKPGTEGTQPAVPEQDPDAQLKALLGEERFAGYRLAQDNRFQEFHQVSQRLQLPESAASDACAIREAAEQAVRALKADSSLSAEARREQLGSLAHETRQALMSTIGTMGMSLYESRWGQWLTALNDSGH